MLLGFVALLACGLSPGRAIAWSIAARSSGLDIEPISRLPAAAQWVLMLLQTIGGSPASVAGGMSVLPVVLMCLATRASALRIAIVWVVGFFALIALGHGILLATQPLLPFDQALLLSSSAVSCVGLSRGAVTFSDAGGYLTVSALMLAGRAWPVLMMCWLACSERQTGHFLTTHSDHH
jgi:Trk-type K+ transport system membrane component